LREPGPTAGREEQKKPSSEALIPEMDTPRNRATSPEDLAAPENGQGEREPASGKPVSGSPAGDALSLPFTELKHRSLRGVFFLTCSNVANLIAGFLASLILARLLTPADFGVVAIGATATMLAMALADGGIAAALVRRPEPPALAELRTLNGIQLTLALAVSVPVAAVALGLGRTGAVTALMILSLPIITLQTPGRVTLSRSMQYDRQVAADAAAQVASQAFAVIAVLLGAGVWGLAGGAVVRAVVATVLITMLGPGFHWPSLRGWRGYGGTIRFGVKFQASFYAFVAREQGLNLLLAARAGVHPLGIWAFTNRIFQFPSVAFNSLYVIGFPAMSNMLARGEEVGPMILRVVRRAAIVGTFVFGTFAAASPKLIPLAFGEQWRESAWIVPFICLSTLLLGSIAVSATSYLPAAGRPGIVAIAAVCFGVVWLAVTAVLLPSAGVAAIGIGNLAGAIVEAAILNAATKQESGVAPYRPLLRPLAVAVVSSGAGLLLCVAGSDGIVTVAASIVVTNALAVIGLWIVCRADLMDTIRLGWGSVRSSMPRMRRPSPSAA
jgi:O-antigen/teichoic acid export membrane protein